MGKKYVILEVYRDNDCHPDRLGKKLYRITNSKTFELLWVNPERIIDEDELITRLGVLARFPAVHPNIDSMKNVLLRLYIPNKKDEWDEWAQDAPLYASADGTLAIRFGDFDKLIDWLRRMPRR